MFRDLEASLSDVEVVHNNLIHAQNYKSDSEQLGKYKE